MQYNPETRESIIKLKDGRTLYKTHNGFKYWVESKKGESTEVTEKYFRTIKHNAKKTKAFL